MSPPSPPPGQGTATDRQGLAGVLARHELDADDEVAHRALAAAEIEAVRVHVQQVPGDSEQRGERGRGPTT